VGLFDSGPLRLLPAPLREPRRAGVAIVLGAALTIVGSLALSGLANLFVPALATPDFPQRGVMALLLLVVFAPLVETLIMAGALSLLDKVFAPTHAVFASAVLWGIAHSLQAAAWGMIIWWPFLIFSTLYMVWRQRGFWPAIGVAASTHALQNLMPAFLVAFAR
jgi:hypothetical protein